MRQFTPRQLKEYIGNNPAPPVLLDVREPWEFQIAHIETSELLPMRQAPAAIDAWMFDREIVVICHHGIRSRQVAWFLERSGFTNIINLEGGVAAWAREVDPKMPTY